MATKRVPTEDEVLGYMGSLSNWGRWGPDDELGTLNLITPAKRAQAGRLVREGISVTCSRLIVPEMAPDVTSIPPLHYMIRTGEHAPSSGPGGSSDFIGLSFHGLTITHLDSLCHQFWDGKMYNGKPASLVGVEQKATAGHIDNAQNGVVTRGVLLDIAQVKGKDWLEAGEAVFTEDLEAAEEAQGVHVEEGDALLLRLGWYKRRQEVGPPASGRPGLHAETLPWLHRRGVSIIAADASQDMEPSGYSKLGLPIHRVGIVAMGLWLIDAANFEELVKVCRELGRWEFMFTVAPLRFYRATGSPVNPLAIF
jgi:kynurenine formamidase